ncbi:DgyrCDS1309 [Dimorphilus gyrociliatus]|uniref:Exocyst complex component 8 n=1 Tax=Dimorphilus gyrociliatus TaxID=2664684 RepID=A0A7I8V8C9_9ANNE|nr:DgyrCDS1309 [Dimorphilus gyrociliatus]
MYELIHMLSDQKALLSSLLETSMLSEKNGGTSEVQDSMKTNENSDNYKYQSLAYLLETVESCPPLSDVPNRYLLHDGKLNKLDCQTYAQTGEVKAFLLNDRFILAERIDKKSSQDKYRFDSIFELEKLAVVNVKDSDKLKNAFQILDFPNTLLFSADSSKQKNIWLEKIDIAKHAIAVKSIEAKLKENMLESEDESYYDDEFDDDNPFRDSPKKSNTKAKTEREKILSWLQDAPDELDVAIAQRHFDEAVDIIEKIRKFIQDNPKDSIFTEYACRIERRESSLVEILMNELKAPPERSVRGGPLFAKRAVSQLIRLGKSSKACQLFLENRSSLRNFNLEQIKYDGVTQSYIQKITGVYFKSLLESGLLFEKAFQKTPQCQSAFISWCDKEIKSYVILFRDRLLLMKANLSTTATCIADARKRLKELEEIGLSFEYLFDMLLRTDFCKLVDECQEKQREIISIDSKHENLWRPSNLQNSQQLTEFEKELENLGFSTIKQYSYDSCFSHLCSATVKFVRNIIVVLNDLEKIKCESIYSSVVNCFSSLLKFQYESYDKIAKEQHELRTTIEMNKKFFKKDLMPFVTNRINKMGIVYNLSV